MLNVKDTENISAVLKVDGMQPNDISNSSLMTINKFVDMIHDPIIQEKPTQEKVKKMDNNNMFLRRNDWNGLRNNLKTLTTDIPLKTSSFKNYMVGVTKSTTNLNNAVTEGITSYEIKKSFTKMNTSNKHIPNFKKYNTLHSPSILKLLPNRQDNNNSHNIIRKSNKMQSQQKQMLIGLYKHKMEFEDDLDNFRNDLEKKKKKLKDLDSNISENHYYPFCIHSNIKQSSTRRSFHKKTISIFGIS